MNQFAAALLMFSAPSLEMLPWLAGQLCSPGSARNGLKRIAINVHDPPRRKHGVFIGASFIAKSIGDEQWISQREYKEKGSKMFL